MGQSQPDQDQVDLAIVGSPSMTTRRTRAGTSPVSHTWCGPSCPCLCQNPVRLYQSPVNIEQYTARTAYSKLKSVPDINDVNNSTTLELRDQ